MRARKVGCKGAPRTTSAIHLHVPATLSNNAIYSWQSKTRSAAFLLGSKERFKNTRLYLGVDASSGIDHTNGNELTNKLIGARSRSWERNVQSFDGDNAAIRHRVARIDDKIEKHLLELRWVSLNIP